MSEDANKDPTPLERNVMVCGGTQMSSCKTASINHSSFVWPPSLLRNETQLYVARKINWTLSCKTHITWGVSRFSIYTEASVCCPGVGISLPSKVPLATMSLISQLKCQASSSELSHYHHSSPQSNYAHLWHYIPALSPSPPPVPRLKNPAPREHDKTQHLGIVSTFPLCQSGDSMSPH